MKKLRPVVLLLGYLSLALLTWGQTIQYAYQTPLQVFTTVSTSGGFRISATGAAFHVLTWNNVGTVSTCQIQADSSVDGVTWGNGDVIASTLCTTSGTVTSTSHVVNFIRINITAISGAGATVSARLTGYVTNPSGGGGGLADPGSNGVLKRTALNVTAIANSADLIALWSGTCNATTFLRGDGACAAASSAPAWSAITNATGNLTLANGTNTTEFDQTNAANWTWANTTAATSGTAQSSPIWNLNGKYWDGAASQTDGWTFQDIVGNGTNGTSSLVLTHSAGGTSGLRQFNLVGSTVRLDFFDRATTNGPGNTTLALSGTSAGQNTSIQLQSSSNVAGFLAMGAVNGIANSNYLNLQSTSIGILGSPIDFSNGAGQISARFATNVFTRYNNEATTGPGVPFVRGSTSQKAETGADASVLSVTPAATVGTYRITVAISVSAATSATIGWTATWTDSNGNAQTPTNLTLIQSGSAAPALTFTTSAAGNYYSSAIIDTNAAGTAIVIKTTFSGTSIAYKVSAVVERIGL